MATYRRVTLSLGAGVVAGVASALYFFYVIYLGRKATGISLFSSSSFAENIRSWEWLLALLVLPLVVAACSTLPTLALGASFTRGIITSAIVYLPFVVLVIYFFTIFVLPVAVYALPAIAVTWVAVIDRFDFVHSSEENSTERIILACASTVVVVLCIFPLSYPLHEEYFVATIVLATILSWTVLPTVAALLLPPRPHEGQQ